MFITNLLVGVGRYRRGEKLSGHQFVRGYALRHLLVLLEKHLATSDKTLLDNLDPLRRFEKVFPVVGEELNKTLNRDIPSAALGMLTLAERELKAKIKNYPAEAVEIIRRVIE
jgi:hypothetical protein